MRQHRLHVELRMRHGLLRGDEFRRLRAQVDHSIVRAGCHAMTCGEHDVRRDQRPGADRAARADDGDDRTCDSLGRRRAAAGDGVTLPRECNQSYEKYRTKNT